MSSIAQLTSSHETDTSWREFTDRDAREAEIFAGITAALIAELGEPAF